METIKTAKKNKVYTAGRMVLVKKGKVHSFMLPIDKLCKKIKDNNPFTDGPINITDLF